MGKRNSYHAAATSGRGLNEGAAPGGPALIIAPGPTRRRDLSDLLTQLGYASVLVPTADDALTVVEHDRCAFTVLDLTDEPEDGPVLMPRLPADCGPVIALRRHGGRTTAAEPAPAG